VKSVNSYSTHSIRVYRNLAVGIIVRFLSSVAETLIAVILVVYLLQVKGLSISEIGLVNAVYFFTVLLLDYPTGVLADVIGRRTCVALGYLVMVLTPVLIMLGRSLWVFVLAEVIYGIGTVLISGAEEALIYDYAELKNIDRSLVAKTFSYMQVFAHIGMAAASLLSSILASLSMDASFLASFILFLSVFLVSLLYEEVVQHKPTQGSRRYIEALSEGFSMTINSKVLRMLLIISVVGAFPQTVFVLSWQPIIASNLKAQLLGPFFLAFQLSATLGGFIASRISRRDQSIQYYVRIINLSLVTRFTVYLVIAAVGRNIAIYVGMIVLWELLFGLARPYTVMVYNRFIPSKYRASILSLFSSIGRGSFGVANIVISTLFSISGYYLPYLYTSIVYLITALIYRKIAKYSIEIEEQSPFDQTL